MRESTSEAFKESRKSRKTLIKNSEVKDSEDEKNTVKIVEEFKRSMLKIDFEFTSYILKKMSVKENKRSRNQKSSISASDCELKSKILNEILTIIADSIIADSITSTFHDFSDYIERDFKNHKRKTITRDIVVRNFEIIKDMFKEERLNDDEFIELDRRFMSKEVR